MSRLQELAKILAHLEGSTDKTDKSPFRQFCQFAPPDIPKVFCSATAVRQEARDPEHQPATHGKVAYTDTGKHCPPPKAAGDIPLLSILSVPKPRDTQSFSFIDPAAANAGDVEQRPVIGGMAADSDAEKLCSSPGFATDKTDRRVDTLPAEWSEGVAQLGEMVRPARIRPDDWRQIVADAARFLRDWGSQAAALGWTTLDIFGAHPTHPVERVDCVGLIAILHGAEVVAISDATICTRNRSGARLTYRRRPLPDSIPLWRLK